MESTTLIVSSLLSSAVIATGITMWFRHRQSLKEKRRVSYEAFLKQLEKIENDELMEVAFSVEVEKLEKMLPSFALVASKGVRECAEELHTLYEKQARQSLKEFHARNTEQMAIPDHEWDTLFGKTERIRKELIDQMSADLQRWW